jgi:PAS domain-containing protein
MRIMEIEGFLTAYEVQHRRKDGCPVWLSLHSRAVRNEEGRIIRFDGRLEEPAVPADDA